MTAACATKLMSKLCTLSSSFPPETQIIGQLENHDHLLLPLYISKVSAGFPSPAADYIEQSVSLDSLIVKNPTSSFIVQAQGNSMIGAGIFDKNYLVVDRSLIAKHDDIVIASINSEYLVKRLKIQSKGKVFLYSENPDFPPIELKEELENIIWGVVICILNPLRV